MFSVVEKIGQRARYSNASVFYKELVNYFRFCWFYCLFDVLLRAINAVSAKNKDMFMQLELAEINQFFRCFMAGG